MSLWLGYVLTFVACFSFGSQYVTIHNCQIGDGLFYQWLVAGGIFSVGIVTNVIANFSKYYPLAMLGGFLWASGNIATVPMFHFLGVAPSFLIWTSVQMVMGWASGRFGWFGTDPQVPESNLLNYLGLGISIVGGIFFLFIQNSKHTKDEVRRIRPIDNDHVSNGSAKDLEEPMEEFFPGIPTKIRRFLGIILAVYAGTLYGFMFVPVTYIQNNHHIYPNASSQGIPYAFSYYTGIYATSTFYFLIYCIYKYFRCGGPLALSKLILPGLIGGAMWGIGQTCWLYANAVLSVAITTPLMTRLPGAITAIYGVFLFKEIRGIRNYIIVIIGTVIVIIGSVLTGLSLSVET